MGFLGTWEWNVAVSTPPRISTASKNFNQWSMVTYVTMSKDSLNRRTFLRNASTASLAGAAGLVATGSAAGRRAAADVERLDHRSAERVFDEHASDLLAGLAAEGYLDRGTAAELPLADGPDTGAARLRRADRSDEVVAAVGADDRHLTVVVEPDDGTAYAMEEGPDGLRRYTPEDGFETLSGVSPDSCSCYNITCERDQYPTEVCEYCSGICDGCCTTTSCGC